MAYWKFANWISWKYTKYYHMLSFQQILSVKNLKKNRTREIN